MSFLLKMFKQHLPTIQIAILKCGCVYLLLFFVAVLSFMPLNNKAFHFSV